ncbi:MAG: hypothetical protein RIQ81_305 [Pseudomonadota bacterium]
MEEPVEVNCPFCGEVFTTFVDISAGNQTYVEDCQVCCRPIQMRISISPKSGRVRLQTDRGGI